MAMAAPRAVARPGAQRSARRRRRWLLRLLRLGRMPTVMLERFSARGSGNIQLQLHPLDRNEPRELDD